MELSFYRFCNLYSTGSGMDVVIVTFARIDYGARIVVQP